MVEAFTKRPSKFAVGTKAFFALLLCGAISFGLLLSLPKAGTELYNMLRYEKTRGFVLDAQKAPKTSGLLNIKVQYKIDGKLHEVLVQHKADLKDSDGKSQWPQGLEVVLYYDPTAPNNAAISFDEIIPQAVFMAFLAIPFAAGALCFLMSLLTGKDAMDQSIGSIRINDIFVLLVFYAGIGVMIYLPLMFVIPEPGSWISGLVILFGGIPIMLAVAFVRKSKKRKLAAQQQPKEEPFLQQ